MTDTPDRQFELCGFDGKIAHLVSMRVSAGPAPLVMQWRGRTFVYRNGAYSEAAATLLDDDDGVFAPVKHAPTLEDVDAELQPKGLPVIALDGPTWVGPWRECGHSYERTIIKARVEADPSLANVIVMLDPDNQWGFWAGLIARTDVWGKGHPTPEAAQQACEAAIVAAWRSR